MNAARLKRGLAALAALCVTAAVPAALAADEITYRTEPGDTLIDLGTAMLVRPSDWVRI
nr:hypothetical protein [Zoogloeaceae bacterium]